MPTYSYRCTECDRAFDIVQAFTDDTLTVCPTCGGALRKVFSPVGVSFNGSGFYRTDSRASAAGGGSTSSAKSESSSPKSESSASSTEKSTPKKDAPKPASSTGTSSGSPTS